MLQSMHEALGMALVCHAWGTGLSCMGQRAAMYMGWKQRMPTRRSTENYNHRGAVGSDMRGRGKALCVLNAFTFLWQSSS